MTTAEVLFVLGITAFAFWKKDIVMYLVAGLSLIGFGYIWIDTSGIVQGSVAMGFGIYTFIKAITVQFGR